MARIRIGTASWTYKSPIESGAYYPGWCKSAEDRLSFYAAEFPLVEVDSSYYALPSERNSNLWVDRTPEDFAFNVKAFRLFTTHQTRPQILPRGMRAALPAELATKKNLYYPTSGGGGICLGMNAQGQVVRATSGACPQSLRTRCGKCSRTPFYACARQASCGGVVFQFPPWLMPRRESYRHIEECKEHLPHYPLAVEFRNRYWLDGDKLEETQAFLGHHHGSFIAVDEPQGFKSSVPPVAGVTGQYAVVRFHGRNRDTWEKRGLASASERFDYYYAREELKEWVPRIALMLENSDEVHLVMNTNNRNQGIVNCLGMNAQGQVARPTRSAARTVAD